MKVSCLNGQTCGTGPQGTPLCTTAGGGGDSLAGAQMVLRSASLWQHESVVPNYPDLRDGATGNSLLQMTVGTLSLAHELQYKLNSGYIAQTTLFELTEQPP
jgi:hypothetical protein